MARDRRRAVQAATATEQEQRGRDASNPNCVTRMVSVVPVNHLDGAQEGDPARQTGRGEGEEVVGSKGFGVGRSTVPRAALSEIRGHCHGGMRDQVDQMQRS